MIWGTKLHDAEPIGDSNLLWLVEGVLLAGTTHAALNSAFYGRMAGLIGSTTPSSELEDPDDPNFPKDENDYLSRLWFRYSKETAERWYIAPFGRVFSSRKLALFTAGGALGGLILAVPATFWQRAELGFGLVILIALFIIGYWYSVVASRGSLRRGARA